MIEIDRELAVRFAKLATEAARRDVAAMREKDDAQAQKDIWHDYGTLLAHATILADKIDVLLEEVAK